MENVKFKNKYNETLAGVLDYKSKGPVIVFVHGFAGDKDESHGLFAKAAEYFATRKLNTFRFDMSGCGESEGDFIDCKPTLTFKKHDPTAYEIFSKFPLFSIYVSQKK